jgi:hypothetical protein
MLGSDQSAADIDVQDSFTSIKFNIGAGLNLKNWTPHIAIEPALCPESVGSLLFPFLNPQAPCSGSVSVSLRERVKNEDFSEFFDVERRNCQCKGASSRHWATTNPVPRLLGCKH